MAGSSPALTNRNSENYFAPSQRSRPPFLHPGRSGLRFPDPESALRRVLDRGRAHPAHRRRDRRLRARPLATGAGLPDRRDRTRRIRRVIAQCLHGAGSRSAGRAPGRGSASSCATIIRSCATTKHCAGARWCRWPMQECICRSGSPATPISTRRRSTPPMSASCSAARTTRCSRIGCTCQSAIMAAPRPSWSPAPG